MTGLTEHPWDLTFHHQPGCRTFVTTVVDSGPLAQAIEHAIVQARRDYGPGFPESKVDVHTTHHRPTPPPSTWEGPPPEPYWVIFVVVHDERPDALYTVQAVT